MAQFELAPIHAPYSVTINLFPLSSNWNDDQKNRYI